MVPLTALTFRDTKKAKSWWKRVRNDIVADARSRGLSRRRFSPAIVGTLVAAAAVAALGIGAAVLRHETRVAGDDPWGDAGSAASSRFIFLSFAAGRSVGERDTPAGREVAARWLGVKAWLQGNEGFADQPPSAVAVWDRYLGYGAALGTTRVASAVIDLGMGNRKRVWSSLAAPGIGCGYGIRGSACGTAGMATSQVLIGATARIVLGALLWAPLSGGCRSFKVTDFLREGGRLGARLLAGTRSGTREAGVARSGRCWCGAPTGSSGPWPTLTPPASLTGEVLWVEVWRTSSPVGRTAHPFRGCTTLPWTTAGRKLVELGLVEREHREHRVLVATPFLSSLSGLEPERGNGIAAQLALGPLPL